MTVEQVIVVCPCCASAIDAQADPDEQTFECVSCGQTWTMHIDADRHTAHALS